MAAFTLNMLFQSELLAEVLKHLDGAPVLTEFALRLSY